MKEWFLVNAGIKPPADGNYVNALQFKTWKSWAALPVAVVLIGCVHHFLP